MSIYWDLFTAFFRCGIFGFGGGQATVPLIENEVVNTFGWLSVGEFSDAYALVNTLPGPITTKMAALVGYKMAGFPGLIIAIIGIVIPSVVAVLILYKLYSTFKDEKWLKGMMIGVRPVVVIMLMQVLFKVAKNAYNINPLGNINWIACLVSVLAAIALFYFKIQPIILIIIALVFGGVFLG